MFGMSDTRRDALGLTLLTASCLLQGSVLLVLGALVPAIMYLAGYRFYEQSGKALLIAALTAPISVFHTLVPSDLAKGLLAALVVLAIALLLRGGRTA